jgi:hypothetical protein
MNPKFVLSFHGSGIRFAYETQQLNSHIILTMTVLIHFPPKHMRAAHCTCWSLWLAPAPYTASHTYGVRNPDKLYRGLHQPLTRGECHVKLTMHHAMNAGNLTKILTHIQSVPEGMCQTSGVFLMLKYTDITQNTYIQSWTVKEIMAREKWGLLAVPNTATRTLTVTWHSSCHWDCNAGLNSVHGYTKMRRQQSFYQYFPTVGYACAM